eukprot:SAG31_NODE_22950_length_514_cov_1.238554_1_plen_78_part_10
MFADDCLACLGCAQKRKQEGNKTASDLRVVAIKKGERKERTMDVQAMRLRRPKESGAVRKVKALQKKLDQIAKLRQEQ